MLFKSLSGLLLLTSSLFALEYHTDGKPIYQPMDITVPAISDTVIVTQPIDVTRQPIDVTRQPIDVVVQPMLDTDNDTIVDIEDNCVHSANLSQDDFDGDGQGDSCDSDDDNDGLPDSFENQYTVLNPLDASDALIDSDGDGFTNLEEYQEGTSIIQAPINDDDQEAEENLETFTLKKGWNLLGVDQEVTISYLKEAIGEEDLLIIKKESQTYYTKGEAYTNETLEKGEGYWIKVANDVSFKYKKQISKGIKKVILTAGWNLINPLQELTLEELKTQLGSDNLLVIQNATTTYKKSYIDAELEFLNDFTQFEKNSGYWIRVAQESVLTYQFEGIDLDSKDIEITQDSTIHLDGTIADEDDRIITLYRWYEGDTLLCEETNSTCDIDPLSVGTHIITLQTTDEEGVIKSQDITITVSEDLTKTLNENGSTSTVNYATNSDIGEMLPEDVITTTPSGLRQVIGFESELLGTKDAPSYLTIRSLLNDKVTTTEVDYDNGIKQKTTPEGRIIKEIFDTGTQLLSRVESGTLHPIVYAYNSDEKVSKKSVQERYTEYTYTSDGKVETITDALGKTTEIKYGIFSKKPIRVTTPDGNTTQYKYNWLKKMTRLTTPTGERHHFAYSGDKITRYTSPLGKVTEFVYSGEQLKEKVLPSGEKIINTYSNDRLASVSTPEGVISYTYITDDLIKSASKGSESLNYEYDGTLLTKINSSGTLDQSIVFGYDNDFKVTGITYADKAFVQTYDRDGLLTRSGDFTIQRDRANGLATSLYDTTLNLTRTISGFGEINKEITTVNGAERFSYEILSRDKTGKILEKKETLGGVETLFSYEYNLRGRLSKVYQDGTLVESYAYDANGNRVLTTSTQRGIIDQSALSNADDGIVQMGDIEYAYDDNGYLSQKIAPTGTTTFEYESSGALKKVTQENGTVISYINDPTGRRVAKLVDGDIVEKYLWKDRTTLLAIYDQYDDLKIRFEYADNRVPYKMIKEHLTYYLAYNQVGSLRAVFDEYGNTIKKINYDSYGNVISDSEPSFDVPIGFAGGLYDQDTKLVRFGYRDYEAHSGKWTAKDPIGFSGGDTNLYAYCNGDPINHVDPNGLWIMALLFVGALVFSAGTIASLALTSANLFQALYNGLALSVGSMVMSIPGVNALAAFGLSAVTNVTFNAAQQFIFNDAFNAKQFIVHTIFDSAPVLGKGFSAASSYILDELSYMMRKVVESTLEKDFFDRSIFFW
jgi:RHS repeat-associated protein